MRNNGDFLKGVYEKAEILLEQKEKKQLKYKKYLKYSSVSALFILIPLLLLQNNVPDINEPLPINEPRVMSFGNIDYSFSNAEFILKSSINSINSTDDFVELKLSVENNLYGDDIGDEITVLGSKETTNFISDYENIIVFLNELDNKYYLNNDSEGILIEYLPNVYVDMFGNEYTTEDIIQKIDRSR